MARKEFDFGGLNETQEAKGQSAASSDDDFYAGLGDLTIKKEEPVKEAPKKADDTKLNDDEFLAMYSKRRKASAAEKKAAELKAAEEEARLEAERLAEEERLRAEEEAARAAEEAAARAAEEEARREAERKAAAEEARRRAEAAKAAAEKAAAELAEKRRLEEEAKKKAEEARVEAELIALKKAEEERIAAEKAAEEAARAAEEQRRQEEEAARAAEEAARVAEEAAAKAREAKELAAKKAAEKEAAERARFEKKLQRDEEKRKKREAADARGTNWKLVGVVAAICVVVIVLSFVLSKVITGGGVGKKGTAEENKQTIITEVKSNLAAATTGINFAMLESRVSIANDEGYVIYFQDGYTLYKLDGTYSKSGLSYQEKCKAASDVKLDKSKAKVVCDGVTSFFVNTQEINDGHVVLNVRLTDDSNATAFISEDIAVNVESAVAAPVVPEEEVTE